MNIVWYILLIVFLIGLFAVLFGSILKSRKSSNKNFNEEAETGSNICPICGSRLKRGEKIHSVVFNGGKLALKDSSLRNVGSIHIYGCPYCYPPKRRIKRICPVCKEEIPDDGYLVGRIWNRRGKIHLHILGCTLCAVNSIKR